MNDKTPEIKLDRALYKKIKTMDRLTMEQTLQSVFNVGFEDAMKLKSSDMDLRVIRSEIGKIKGIGENRLNEIMKVIEAHV